MLGEAGLEEEAESVLHHALHRVNGAARGENLQWLARLRSQRSAIVGQLWSALGKGDRSAETALAQHYLTGDGVPRNCEQARVLLRAASKNGDIEALRQLRKLGRTCR